MNKNRRVVRKQPRKDSRQKRVNFDNTREDKFIKDESSSNAYAWYAKNKQLADSAAMLGFSQTTGMPDANGVTNPGVMVYPFVTSIGGFNSRMIYQAANQIYSYTVHANSRNVSYSASDQMALILAGKEVFVGISNLIRVYGLMLLTNQENSYLPRALVEGCGITYPSARSSYNQMLWDINSLIADSRQIWLPNVMPVITRQFWMSTHVYMDSESNKGQYFMYVPSCLRYYDETTSSDGAMLVPEQGWDPGNPITWAAAVGIVRDMITKLLNSESRGVIFGDILKAYGEDSIYRIEFVDPNYTVTPVYDKEVLSQMENCTFMARSISAPNAASTIKVNTGSGLITEVQGGGSGSALGLSTSAENAFPVTPILNFHFKGQPTPEQIMVATRCTAVGNAFNVDTSNNGGNLPRSCGTEWIYAPFILKYGPLTDGGQTISRVYLVQQFKDVLWTTNAVTNWQRITEHMKFDWSPVIYAVTQTGESTTSYGNISIYNYCGDVDNYIPITEAELYRMHYTAMLSEFGVPVIE